MSTYYFSMERVLELKANKEKNVMEKFATLLNELSHQKTLLITFLKELEGFKVKGQRIIGINGLKQQLLYKQTIEERIMEQNEVIQNISDKLEFVRLELVSAQKERKIMEKLKEKDFNNFQEDLKTMEQKELDEMAILKFNRIEI